MQPWILYAILAALFASCTAIFAKAGLKNVDSDIATAIRTSLILIITWGMVIIKGKVSQVQILNKHNWIFLTLSAIATGASWLYYYKALQIGDVAKVSAIDKGSIVFTVVLSFIFLKEALTPQLLLGTALVLIGVLVIIWK